LQQKSIIFSGMNQESETRI